MQQIHILEVQVHLVEQLQETLLQGTKIASGETAILMDLNLMLQSNQKMIGVLHQQLLLIGVKVDVMYQLVPSGLEMLMTSIQWAEVSKAIGTLQLRE
jgi:hypothetical protein